MSKAKQKKIENIRLQLALVESAISRYNLKVSERMANKEFFMVKYMNESEEIENLMWRRHILSTNFRRLLYKNL
jgi:hypothetical protein